MQSETRSIRSWSSRADILNSSINWSKYIGLPDIFSPGHFYHRQSTTRTIFTPDIFSSGHCALGQFATRTIVHQDNLPPGQYFTRAIFLPDSYIQGLPSTKIHLHFFDNILSLLQHMSYDRCVVISVSEKFF